MSTTTLELLSPARDAAIGRTAIDCGADAVYIGAPAFGARAAAGNSIADIAGLAEYAHRFGARVYVTMNTLLLDNELEDARRMVWQLYDAGADALIIQDMAYLEMDIPPIALHASTQCDIRTPAKARMLAQAGFSQLVLPREFTPTQIAETAQAAGVPVEVFIHGARCVSYSGDCQMGFVATGRSANRGVCPQMCRLPFDLVDSTGKPLAPRRHYLSLSDLRTPDLSVLVNAGATSFKIEGRLKDRRYVANVTAWYSNELDKLIASSGGRYVRASYGHSKPGFTPDIERSFFRRPNGGGREATLGSPKDTGIAVAKVTAADRRSFKVDKSGFANGDGLGFFNSNGEFTGFRLNRAEGQECFAAGTIAGLTRGTTIFRNSDKAFNDTVDSARPERKVRISFSLYKADENGFCINAHDESSAEAEVRVESAYAQARSDQKTHRFNIMARLGDTHFELEHVADELGDRFVAASILTEGRRAALEALATARMHNFRRFARRKPSLASDSFSTLAPLSYHDNVSNALSRHFYTSHGAQIGESALEASVPAAGKGRQVMSTRYCIRRELGACLRTPDAGKLPEPLFLQNESGTYRLDFDCNRCGMNIIAEKNKRQA